MGDPIFGVYLKKDARRSYLFQDVGRWEEKSMWVVPEGETDQ